jgi:hypothetical protein
MSTITIRESLKRFVRREQEAGVLSLRTQDVADLYNLFFLSPHKVELELVPDNEKITNTELPKVSWLSEREIDRLGLVYESLVYYHNLPIVKDNLSDVERKMVKVATGFLFTGTFAQFFEDSKLRQSQIYQMYNPYDALTKLMGKNIDTIDDERRKTLDSP